MEVRNIASDESRAKSADYSKISDLVSSFLSSKACHKNDI